MSFPIGSKRYHQEKPLTPSSWKAPYCDCGERQCCDRPRIPLAHATSSTLSARKSTSSRISRCIRKMLLCSRGEYGGAQVHDRAERVGKFKHPGESELDTSPPYGQTPFIHGYYDRYGKDVMPSPAINEMESPTPELPSEARQCEDKDIYNDTRMRRRVMAPQSPTGHNNSSVPGIRRRDRICKYSANQNISIPFVVELPGDDGQYTADGQHFHPVVTRPRTLPHALGPKEQSTPSPVDLSSFASHAFLPLNSGLSGSSNAFTNDLCSNAYGQTANFSHINPAIIHQSSNEMSQSHQLEYAAVLPSEPNAEPSVIFHTRPDASGLLQPHHTINQSSSPVVTRLGMPASKTPDLPQLRTSFETQRTSPASDDHQVTQSLDCPSLSTSSTSTVSPVIPNKEDQQSTPGPYCAQQNVSNPSPTTPHDVTSPVPAYYFASMPPTNMHIVGLQSFYPGYSPPNQPVIGAYKDAISAACVYPGGQIVPPPFSTSPVTPTYGGPAFYHPTTAYQHPTPQMAWTPVTALAQHNYQPAHCGSQGFFSQSEEVINGPLLPPSPAISAWGPTSARIAGRTAQEPESPVTARKEQQGIPPASPPDTASPLQCGSCHATFKGKYAKGNRDRHLRNAHADIPKTFECRDPDCHLVYKRADARRKHEWKKHKMQGSKSEKRKERISSADVQGREYQQRGERRVSWGEPVRFVMVPVN